MTKTDETIKPDETATEAMQEPQAAKKPRRKKAAHPEEEPKLEDAPAAQEAVAPEAQPAPPLDYEIQLQRSIELWLRQYQSMNVTAQQDLLYNLMNERLYWRLIYYMRKYPERLTSSRSTYTDRCVGAEELMAYLGYKDQNSYSLQWLESHHMPTREDAQSHIILLNAQFNALIAVESNCPIASLKRNFSLDNDELEILGSLIAVMSEETLLRLMTVAWADFSIRLPTVTFICDLLSDSRERHEHILSLLAESGTLRRMRLVIAERHALFPNYTPLAYAPLSVEQNVIDAYMGRVSTTDLPPNMTIHFNALPRRAVLGQASALDELEYLIQSPAARLCLVGPRHAGRRILIASIAIHSKKKQLLEIDACREFERLQPQDIEPRFAYIMREALLKGCILLLRFDGLDDKAELLSKLVEHQTSIARVVSFYPGEIVLLANKSNAFLDDAFDKPTYIHVPPPSIETACQIWLKALAPWCEKEEGMRMADAFSRNYALPIGSIFEIVKDASDALQSVRNAPTTLQSHNILNEIRKSFRHQLGSLAEITVSDVPLSGVVLPTEAKAQVNEILEYAKNLHNVLDVWGFRQRSPYGNALSILFAGPPGTGKTLLACALANELGKVLYRVDLSRIVDKYIGETEKNLGRIFDEAAKAQAIILFDEADSLFAKRTEVKSSNDRYANLEINFLLQKLESYNGITILTTNLSKSIDEAFRRRLRFIIDFPMPDVPSRIALWKRMMPPGAPLSDDIRWTWLAKTFEMSGGYIRNAVLKAAITASAAHEPISMSHLAKAAADEARSMGKLMRIDEDYDYYDDDDDDR